MAVQNKNKIGDKVKIKMTSIPSNEKISFSVFEKLKQNLKEFEEKYNALLEADEDLIFELDQHGRFVKVNEYGPTFLEYVSDELIGKHFIELAASKDNEFITRSFQKIINSKNLVSFKAAMMSKFGKEVLIEFNCRALFFEDNLSGVIGVGKNVNLLKYEREKNRLIYSKLDEAERLLSIERSRSMHKKALLEELNRLKNEFISNISHELRTPLASIIGFSETIETDKDMSMEMRNEFNSVILKEGKKLAHLINDVLDISKVEGNVVELSRSEFDVIKLLNDVIEFFKPNIEEKDLNLTLELPDEEIIINADAERIEQVFKGLISNSIKFTKNKGRITIFAQDLYKEVEIIISDTGVGIPDEDLPHIFDKFYRVSRPGTEISGAGLGLVFVK
ncbi:MAG: PAS domain-containing sensor histidine kinase, partial [Ignavibacteriaceae bacterium]